MLAQPDMPLTVENFVYINWFGEKTLADLKGEEIAEVEEFLEAVAA
jgi:ABC-type Mn2+/Zn2+ transport system ATPase subunit